MELEAGRERPTVAGGGMSRQRDVFPLPPLFGRDDADAAPAPSSRKSRLRLSRRLDEDAVATRAVSSLNCLMGVEAKCMPRGGVELASHKAVRQHILRAVRRLGPPPPGVTPSVAFGELRGSSLYEDELVSSTVQPLDLSLVSLPEVGSQPIDLSAIYGTGGDDFVARFCSSALAERQVAQAALREGPRRAYMDEGLAQSGPDYARFLRRLDAAGMLVFDTAPGVEQIGFFGVSKKGGKVRLVIDCRRANCHFAPPAPCAIEHRRRHRRP